MRHKTRKVMAMVALMALMVGCGTLYKATVTITQVVDMAMTDWAAMSKAGKTTPQIDAAVIKAHDKYRAACGIARKALESYRDRGDKAAYMVALETLRASASDVIAAIAPALTAPQTESFKSQLKEANSL